MTFRKLPDLNKLKEHLKYEPDTGYLYWLKGGHARQLDKPAGHVTKEGYVVMTFEGKQYLGHRLAWLLHYGSVPGQLDHVNRDKADNRIENLRECTCSDNAHNRKAKGIARTSSGKWQARIKIDGKLTYIGQNECPLLAHMMYLDKKRSLNPVFSI